MCPLPPIGMPSSEATSTDRGEWASMLGMAGMFVGTILLGLVIRPFYDANQLQPSENPDRPQAGTACWNS